MRLAAAALTVTLALAAGCGGDDEETTSAETTTGPTATGPTGPESEQVAQPPEERDDGPAAGDSGSPGATPRAALESFFTSGDPALVCGELATESLLSSAYGDEKGCRQAQVPAATPDAIEIVELEESADEATATVIPDGGPNDGIETDVVLVNEGGAWLVDSLEADVPAGP